MLSIIIPAIVILVERKGVNYLEFKNILLARLCILIKWRGQAKSLLLKVIEKYNESYIAHKLLAEVYESEGGMRKAIDEYVQVIDIRKKDYYSYYKIGKLLYQLGKEEESATILNNLIEKKPEFYKARILLGKVLYSEENYKDALNMFLSSKEYCPDNYKVYYRLGMTHIALNDFANAREDYIKATELKPDLYIAYFNLGQIALLYNELDKAKEYFSKVLYIASLSAKAYFQVARISVIQKDNDKAIELINKALGLDYRVIEQVDSEPVFIPIRRAMAIKTENTDKEEVSIGFISKEDEAVINHLEETYKIIQRMGMQK